MKDSEKAAVYLRVSNGDDGRQKSTTDQLHETRGFATKEGLEIIESLIYRDEGISGRSIEGRVELQRLLADVDSGHMAKMGVTILLCWGVDRLGRNMRESLNIEHALMMHGIRLMTVREGCAPRENGEGRLHFAIEALIAESYSESLSKLLRRAHKDAGAKGLFWGPETPYGYRRISRTLRIDAKEAELVREVFRLFQEGHNRYTIARMLTERKVPKRHGRALWGVDEITRILTSDAVIGVRVQKGVVWNGRCNVRNPKKEDWIITPWAHEAIIDLDTFVKVQRLLRDQSRNFNVKKKHFALLSGIGLLVCGKCGGSYNSSIAHIMRSIDTGKIKGLDRYYVCGRQGRHGDCGNRGVRQEVLDGVVLRRIAAYVKDSDDVRRKWREFKKAGIEKLLPLKGKLTAVEAEINQFEQKEKRLVDALGSGDMPKGVFGKHMEEVARRLNTLREERQSVRKRLAAFDKGFDESDYLKMLENFHAQFGAIPPESRKMLIKQLIKKITINGPYEFVIETTFLPEPIYFPFGHDYGPKSRETGQNVPAGEPVNIGELKHPTTKEEHTCLEG